VVIASAIFGLGGWIFAQHGTINRLEERIKGLESSAAELKSVEATIAEHRGRSPELTNTLEV
jgi:hypothetical protein